MLLSMCPARQEQEMGQQSELLTQKLLHSYNYLLKHAYLPRVAFHNEIPFSVLDIINLWPNNNINNVLLSVYNR